MKVEYIKHKFENFYCESHNRKATHICIKVQDDGFVHVYFHCDPKLGGILLPCKIIFKKEAKTTKSNLAR